MKRIPFFIFCTMLGLASCSGFQEIVSTETTDENYTQLQEYGTSNNPLVKEIKVYNRAGDQNYNERSTQNPNANTAPTYYERAETSNNIIQNPTSDAGTNSEYFDPTVASQPQVVNNYYGDYYSANYSRNWRRFNDPFIGINYGPSINFIGARSIYRNSWGFSYGIGFGNPWYDPFFYDPFFYDPFCRTPFFYDPFFNSYYYPASSYAWCNSYYYPYGGWYRNFYTNYDPYYSTVSDRSVPTRRTSSRAQAGNIGTVRNRPSTVNTGGSTESNTQNPFYSTTPNSISSRDPRSGRTKDYRINNPSNPGATSISKDYGTINSSGSKRSKPNQNLKVAPNSSGSGISVGNGNLEINGGSNSPRINDRSGSGGGRSRYSSPSGDGFSPSSPSRGSEISSPNRSGSGRVRPR